MSKASKPTSKPVAEAQTSAALVKAVVLTDGLFGKVGQVISVPAAIANDSTDLDPHPDAVKNAENK